MTTEKPGVLENIIRFAIAHRWLMLALTLVLVGVGIWSFTKLPIDATPDITNVQVQINTEAPGYSPLESEQRVTYPIETALADGKADDAGKHGFPRDQWSCDAPDFSMSARIRKDPLAA